MTMKQANKKSFWIFLLLVLVIIALPFAIATFVYFIEIKPHVNTETNTFVESIKNVTDPQTKIREIANFTENGYYQTYNNKNLSPFSPLASIWGFQVYDDPQKLRIRANLLFANDPYFIAYFKTGACGESAVLFNFVANKAGFESRIVGTMAEDHVWDEVKIDNRWVQADPTIYYHYYTHPKTYPVYVDFWFDNPQAYSKIGWVEGGYSTVFVFDTNEDLTTKYCITSELSVVCQNCEYIKIKPEGSRTFSIDQEMHNSEGTFNLGRKNYSILAGKTFVPFLLVREKNTTISLMDNENVNITSFSEEIRPTIWSQVLFVLGLIILFILAVLFIIQGVIEIYKKLKSRRSHGLYRPVDAGPEQKIIGCETRTEEDEGVLADLGDGKGDR